MSPGCVGGQGKAPPHKNSSQTGPHCTGLGRDMWPQERPTHGWAARALPGCGLGDKVLSFLPCRWQQGIQSLPRCFLKQQNACLGSLRAGIAAMSGVLQLHPWAGALTAASSNAMAPRGMSAPLCSHQHLVADHTGAGTTLLRLLRSPGRAALPPRMASLPRWSQHSRVASPATRSALAGSRHGCCLGHISHSSLFFQMLCNLAPASSLQDGLSGEPCGERLMPPSPHASRFLPAVPCHAPHSSHPAMGLGLLRLHLGGLGTWSSVTALSPLQGSLGRHESGLAALAWLPLQGKSK